MFNGGRIIKSVSELNFTGDGVTVTTKGSTVIVNIPGSGVVPPPAVQYTIFTESTTPPTVTLVGDRWFNTDTGILYTAVSGNSGYVWVEL